LHSVTLDPARNLIEVTLTGFFSGEDAGWIAEEVLNTIRSLGDAMGQHVTLYDVSKVQIASKQTMAVLNGTFANPEHRQYWAKRVAFCTASTLGRMQLQRTREVRPDIEIFEDRETALAWLLA
jgi:hypothetical protein